jgi:hypothetical protein
LGRRIPERLLTSGKHAGLEDAQKETSGHQSTPVLDETLANHHQSKPEHTNRHCGHLLVN